MMGGHTKKRKIPDGMDEEMRDFRDEAMEKLKKQMQQAFEVSQAQD
jgi:hypothetical protein